MTVNKDKAKKYLQIATDSDVNTGSIIDWKKHDERFHGGWFNPKTMTCSLREKAAKSLSRTDNSDMLRNAPSDHQLTPIAKAQVRAQKVLDEVGGTVLGSAMAKEFRDNGTASILGQSVTTPGDLAAAAQIYSNPSFETFRWFIIKDGKVAYQTGATSRLPKHTAVAVKGYTFNALHYALSQLGKVDGIYILHNHPSGDVRMSKPDKENTLISTKFLPEKFGVKFLGQIVIDHDKYSFHHPDGTLDEELPIENVATDKHTPELDSPLLGIELTKSSEVASFAAKIQKLCEQGTDDAQIIVRQSHKVSGIATCKLSALMGMDTDKLGDLMRRYVIASAGSDVSIVYNRVANPQYDDKIADCIMKNIFLDAVSRKTGKGQHRSLRHERALNPEYNGYEYGIPLNKGMTPTYVVEPTQF